MATDLPKSSWKHARPFRLGELEVLPASSEIRGRRGTQRVRPLLMDILLRLAAQPGEVVRRETLLEDVWPRRMVNDEVLSRAIAELRTALGDDARDARYVETLPKIGYRLVAAVTALEGGAQGAPGIPMAAAKPAFGATGPTGEASTVPAIPGPAAGKRGAWIAGGVLLVGALAGIAAFMATSHAPAPPDVARRLVAARPLTSDPGLELAPRFSPDGKRVAFAVAEGGAARIAIQEVEGSARRWIGATDAVQAAPVFHPDGRRIAYWRSRGPDCAIVEHDLASGAEKLLLDCRLRPRSRFDISGDGRWLVFSAQPRADYPAGLQLLDLGEGRITVLTSPEPGAGDDLYPRFSPDAKRIAFFRGGESHRMAWMLDREAPGSARAVTPLEGLSYGLAWLGREGPLLVSADWFGFRALNRLDPASGEGTLLGARGARFPDVGPGGEIVFENAVYSANAWLANLESNAEPQPLWPSTRYTNQPEFSPDGRQVAFASNRDGLDGIYVAALDGAPRRIAASEAHRFLRPHWSHDGRSVYAVRIAMERSGAAVQEAVRIPVDGGEPAVIAALGRAVNDVREAGDGRWLLWAEMSGTAMRLLRSPREDPGKGERLPWPAASHFQARGDRVVLAQPNLARLTACRLSDLACEPLPLEVPPQDLYHWTLGPRGLYLRVREGESPRVARYDLATRSLSPTFAVAPSGAGTSLAISPDERTALVIRETGPAIDLMLAR